MSHVTNLELSTMSSTLWCFLGNFWHVLANVDCFCGQGGTVWSETENPCLSPENLAVTPHGDNLFRPLHGISPPFLLQVILPLSRCFPYQLTYQPDFCQRKIATPTTSAQKIYPLTNGPTKKQENSVPIPPPDMIPHQPPSNSLFCPPHTPADEVPPLQESPPVAIVPN